LKNNEKGKPNLQKGGKTNSGLKRRQNRKEKQKTGKVVQAWGKEKRWSHGQIAAKPGQKEKLYGAKPKKSAIITVTW